MDNAMISRVEKAKRYADQPERFQFQSFIVSVQGSNNPYHISYNDGKFDSDYDYFIKHGYSQHTLALEKILAGMIAPPAQQENETYVMDSSRINKMEKAKQYAQERGRFNFENFKVLVTGDNNTHTVHFDNGKFQCTCEFSKSRGYCQHSMALERILTDMIEVKHAEASVSS